MYLNDACDVRPPGARRRGVQADRPHEDRLVRGAADVAARLAARPRNTRRTSRERSASIAAAPLGTRYWRVSTSQGTTPLKKFVVGDLPEVVENEIDGDPIPTAVTLPVTINGRIFPREDVDLWTFSAAAGDVVSCDVCAARIGSPLDAHLEVHGPDGQLVAENAPMPGPRRRPALQGARRRPLRAAHLRYGVPRQPGFRLSAHRHARAGRRRRPIRSGAAATGRSTCTCSEPTCRPTISASTCPIAIRPRSCRIRNSAGAPAATCGSS